MKTITCNMSTVNPVTKGPKLPCLPSDFTPTGAPSDPPGEEYGLFAGEPQGRDFELQFPTRGAGCSTPPSPSYFFAVPGVKTPLSPRAAMPVCSRRLRSRRSSTPLSMVSRPRPWASRADQIRPSSLTAARDSMSLLPVRRSWKTPAGVEAGRRGGFGFVIGIGIEVSCR